MVRGDYPELVEGVGFRVKMGSFGILEGDHWYTIGRLWMWGSWEELFIVVESGREVSVDDRMQEFGEASM